MFETRKKIRGVNKIGRQLLEQGTSSDDFWEADYFGLMELLATEADDEFDEANPALLGGEFDEL